MKYLLYAHKSTNEEERQVLSIESQLAELKEFAAKEKLACPPNPPACKAGGKSPERRPSFPAYAEASADK